MTGCRNIHALFPDLLHRSFYIPKTNRTLISSITFAAVGSCCVESYAVYSTVSSTSAGSSHGKQHVLKHFFGLSTYLCYTFSFFCELGTPELNMSSCSDKIIQCQISITSSQVTTISCARTEWLVGGLAAGASFIGCPHGSKCT